MTGQEGVVECAYVASDLTEATYFSTPLVLGPNGMEKNLGLGSLTAYEQVLIKTVQRGKGGKMLNRYDVDRKLFDNRVKIFVSHKNK